jgi:molybdopterin synthase catalytic subunit
MEKETRGAPIDLGAVMAAIKGHLDYGKVGMVLYHNGVVRSTSRDGRAVSGLRVKVDHDKLKAILDRYRRRPGIIDIQIQIAEERDLVVGDDVMFLAVAGDIRDNVVPVLRDVLDEVKSTVTAKTEFFV